MSHACDCEWPEGVPSIHCRAVQFLWKACGDLHGLGGLGACKRLDARIRRSDSMPPFEAAMLPNLREGGYTIILPDPNPSDASAREGLLVYHELAHVILHRDDPFFRQRRFGVSTCYDVMLEAWCDNFALAMLLTFFGWHPLRDEREAHAFLRTGETLKPPLSDALLASRIRRLTNRRRVRRDRPAAPLHRLAKLLLQRAGTAD